MNSPSTTPTISPISSSPRFRGEVLKQIYRVWLFRKLLPVLLLEIILFAVIFYQIAQAIFFQRIVENAMNVFFTRPTGIFAFFVSAFINATVVTKLLIIAIAASLAFLIRHLTQGVLRYILVKENYFSSLKKQ